MKERTRDLARQLNSIVDGLMRDRIAPTYRTTDKKTVDVWGNGQERGVEAMQSQRDLESSNRKRINGVGKNT